MWLLESRANETRPIDCQYSDRAGDTSSPRQGDLKGLRLPRNTRTYFAPCGVAVAEALQQIECAGFLDRFLAAVDVKFGVDALELCLERIERHDEVFS